jgi:hypothetical protein
MTLKIENLKEFEAVQAGDVVIVQLPTRYSGYMLSDRIINGGQITMSKDETIYRYIAPKLTWIKTVLKDGSEMTPQEVNAIHNKYYDEDDERIVYPSLEEEFEHRKVLETISQGEKVYLEEEAIKEPVQYIVVGVLKDTGNPFIETAISYGKGRFYTGDTSFFKLNVTAVIGDTLKKFAIEAQLPFSNSNHSGYKYAKIKDQYVIGNGSKWEKQSDNSFSYFPTLNAAQTYEDNLRKEIRDYLLAKFNMNIVGKVAAAEIFSDLQGILKRVESLNVMKKSDDEKRYTEQAIQRLMKKMGELV